MSSHGICYYVKIFEEGYQANDLAYETGDVVRKQFKGVYEMLRNIAIGLYGLAIQINQAAYQAIAVYFRQVDFIDF